MIIADSRWEIGPYVVRQAVRPDNPAWPAYLVFRGDKLVGKSFSMPDLDACKWLERQKREETVCAAPPCDKEREHSMRGLRGIAKARAFSVSARNAFRKKRKLLNGSLETATLLLPDLEEIT